MNNKSLKCKVCRGFTKVRKIEALINDAYKSGRQPNPEIITALEQAQGTLLGLLSKAEEAKIPIDEIIVSVNGTYHE